MSGKTSTTSIMILQYMIINIEKLFEIMVSHNLKKECAKYKKMHIMHILASKLSEYFIAARINHIK